MFGISMFRKANAVHNLTIILEHKHSSIYLDVIKCALFRHVTGSIAESVKSVRPNHMCWAACRRKRRRRRCLSGKIRFHLLSPPNHCIFSGFRKQIPFSLATCNDISLSLRGMDATCLFKVEYETLSIAKRYTFPFSKHVERIAINSYLCKANETANGDSACCQTNLRQHVERKQMCIFLLIQYNVRIF